MLWTKQVYLLRRLGAGCASTGSIPPVDGDGAAARNREWFHMMNADVISMPDKWEYPWYAAWDLAFHAIALRFVDPDFAKQQLELMLREHYPHPNGQIPAYEWNFGDVNPPVHAWATLFNYRLERRAPGRRARAPERRSFKKLLLNFTWWVNRKDRERPQRLRGRIPRPRQHRRLRPQRPAAHGRVPGAGRRHGVDGALLPEHAPDRDRAGAGGPHLRGPGDQVLRALLWIASAMDRSGRRGGHVGRGGRLLLRRAAAAGRVAPPGSRCARWWACCRSALRRCIRRR